MKIFVSWSKEPSKQIAEEVKHLVEASLPGTMVWMSEVDIGKGERWGVQIMNELDQTDVGIICCTENNYLEPWLHFEAGALSKSVQHGMVHPLCFGISFSNLPGTLSQFQATKFDRADILKLIHSINEKSDNKIKSAAIDEKFKRAWFAFEQAVNDEIANAPKSTGKAPAVESPHQDDAELSEGERSLLKLLTKSGRPLSVDEIAAAMSVSLIRAQHYVSEMIRKKYLIRPIIVSGGGPTRHRMSTKGNAYAVENDWA